MEMYIPVYLAPRSHCKERHNVAPFVCSVNLSKMKNMQLHPFPVTLGYYRSVI